MPADNHAIAQRPARLNRVQSTGAKAQQTQQNDINMHNRRIKCYVVLGGGGGGGLTGLIYNTVVDVPPGTPFTNIIMDMITYPCLD